MLLALPAASGLRTRLQDNDLWWHLATGEWIVRHGTVPWSDPFSYTAAGRPWIAYSWLPEVVLHLVATRFGFAALRWTGAAVLVATVAASYSSCRAAGARRIVAVVATTLGSLAGTGAWSVRPQTVSLLLLALVLRAVYAAPRSYSRRLAPLTVAVWANCHILFFLGPAVFAFAAASKALERRRDRELEWLTVASCVAVLLNPYGLWLVAQVPTMAAQPAAVQAVNEFRSPDLAGLPGVFFAALLVVGIVLLAAAPRRPSTFEIGSFVGSVALALWTQKNMATFGLFAAPTVALALGSLWPPGPSRPAPPPAALVVLHWVAAVAVVAALVVAAPRERGWRQAIDPGEFPVAAADFLAERYSGRRLFNDFDWGGFLIFRLYPATRVSIDGRTQVYGSELLADYTRTHFGLAGWERFFERCDPEIVLWPRQGALASLVRQRPGWRIVYEDDVAVVFERRAI